MKTLETEFKSGGRTLRQIKREGMIALYELRNKAGTLYGYEVIRVQIHPAETLPSGKSYPEREGYPSNEQWGDEAFSYGANNEKGALEAFEEWVRQGSAKVPLNDLVSKEGHDSGQ